jgi:predicted regulator of Ras-like GTPase activity (Roadblock/LC7/MglB family)
MTHSQVTGELAWLLDNLTRQVAHVTQALVFSGDGLVVAASSELSREDGERLSALGAALQSLARGAGQQLRGGEPQQTIVELDSLFLLVTTAGQGTSLAVIATVEAEIGLVAYEMAILVGGMGKYLTARPRGRDEQGSRLRRNHAPF